MNLVVINFIGCATATIYKHDSLLEHYFAASVVFVSMVLVLFCMNVVFEIDFSLVGHLWSNVL